MKSHISGGHERHCRGNRARADRIHVALTGRFRVFRWPLLVAALAFLNASMTFQNVWPTAQIAWRNALSLELAVCVLAAAAARKHALRVSRDLLPAVWMALVAGHYLDVTGPGLYGRPFNLYWDAPHLGNVTAMLLRAVPVWAILLGGIGAAICSVLVFLLARVAWTQVASAVRVRPPRYALAGLALLVVATFAGQKLAFPGFGAVPFADPVAPTLLKQARFVLATLGPSPTSPALAASPELDADLDGLADGDVLVIFVESYGAIAFDERELSSALAPARSVLAGAIRDSGRRVVSAFVKSPTFGGSSWLAHLSLLSGVEVRDQYQYAAMMASRRRTLVSSFARRGYRTVALMPGMRQAWPEGAFYGFDVVYGHHDLAYRGPRFGWWSIPDQYALAKLDALERNRPARPPLFVVFPTSTTHAPFGPVAPYQPDWARVLTDDAFDQGDLERAFAAAPDLTDLRPSYVNAMAYEYTALAGYLRQHHDDMQLIVIGDHQPAAAVSGRDASWDVPVHVIGKQTEILDRLLDSGFSDGLEPHRPTLGEMHTLAPALLNAFSAQRTSEHVAN